VQARNKLLEHVRRRGKHYIYLIFTDDDASLSLRPSSMPEGAMTQQLDDPWREFERLLLHWLPAAGLARPSQACHASAGCLGPSPCYLFLFWLVTSL